jgi:hypothetical protein
MNKNKTLTIDPSGIGTTGIFIYCPNALSQDQSPTKKLKKIKDEFTYLFTEFKSRKWEEHLDYIIEMVKEQKPKFIVYETTNYIHKRMQSSLDLLKLIGGIVCLQHVFPFIEKINSIAVNQVKNFKNKLWLGKEEIEGLTCETGRGKGWKYQGVRISLHQLDALVIYHLWSGRSLESKKNIQKKIKELISKKRLGIRQKEDLAKLEKFLASN